MEILLLDKIVLLFTIVFFFSFLLYFSGVLRIFRKGSENSFLSKSTASFSVLVACKNEEEKIHQLINSLKNLDYPANKFEIIIVDDNSTDNSLGKIEDLIKGFSNFKVISSGKKSITGKKGALQKGLEIAGKDFIIVTDADCVVPPLLLQFYNDRFQTGSDVVIGVSPFKLLKNSFWSKYASFDNLRSYLNIFAFSGLGLPYSATARNFAFNKQKFLSQGGYLSLTGTLSGDDDLLINLAVSLGWKIDYLLNTESFVFSHGKENLNSFLKQKARHTESSKFYSKKMKVVLATWHILNLYAYFSICYFWVSTAFVIPFFVKIFL
ncbi:MAG: glycosyltransferase, partial [Ignavibacteriaceae bacterium]|nr:glycosyltransferase [Ignavibacteriaceae bacterium]